MKVWDCVGEGNTKGSYQLCRSINDLAWDGDSQRVIAVGDGKERFGACITADSGNSVGEISGQTAQINCVAMRLQRPFRAATGSDDTTTAFYHGAPYKFNTSLRGQHDRYIYGTQFSPDGSTLVTVGADKKIWLYDGKTGEAKGQIGADEHKGSIFSVSWSKDSKRFVTASADQTVKIWDAEAGKSVHSWRIGQEGVVSVQSQQVGVVWPARSDGLVLSLSLSGDLNYLDEASAKATKIVQGHAKSITALTPQFDATTFWTGSSDGRVCQWTTGEAKEIDGEQPKNKIGGLAKLEKHVAVASWDDKLRLVDAGAGTFVGAASSTEGSPQGIAQAGSYTVVATHKGLSVFKGDQQLSHLATTFTPTAVAATKDLVAVGGDDSALYIYTISAEKLTKKETLSGQASQVSALTFSPSGELAAGFASGKIIVFNSSWQPDITRWTSHTARVTAIAWTKDGQFAASSSLDCSVRVWSVKKPGARVGSMSAHKESATGVAWSEDDGSHEKLISTGADGAVKVWKVEGLA